MPPLTLRSIGTLFAFFAITLACEEEGIIRLRVEGAFDPTALDFGEVPVGEAKPLPVTLENIGGAAFEIVSVEVPQGYTLRGIKQEFEGSTMQAGMKQSFEVVFIPMTEGPHDAQLVINISDEQKVTLDLSGNGRLVRLPNIVAMPAAVDFGTVELGGESRANVTLTNEGNAAGTIDRATFAGMSNEFSLATALPLTIAEGASAQIELLFSPNNQGDKNDRVTLTLRESVPEVSIVLTGEGRLPLGEIICTPGRVEFGPVERGLTLSREVDCTARGGAARLVGARIEGATDQFFLPSPPTTTDLATDQSTKVNITFRPDGLPDVHNGELVVNFTGDAGSGSAVVQLSGEVVPPPPTATAVTVALSWNTDYTDVDLHLIRPSNRQDSYDSMFEEDADCFFGNPAPDWNTPNSATDDPFLDDDDVDGFGPETINLDQTQAGAYDVYVHYYSDSGIGPTTPTVQIHLAGQLAGTFNRPNLDCNEVWHVGTIDWNGTNGTFSMANDVHYTSVGNCF